MNYEVAEEISTKNEIKFSQNENNSLLDPNNLNIYDTGDINVKVDIILKEHVSDANEADFYKHLNHVGQIQQYSNIDSETESSDMNNLNYVKYSGYTSEVVETDDSEALDEKYYKDNIHNQGNERTRISQISTQAEKKRDYRTRLKETNPELWSAIKQKEACKRREQREDRRLILIELQKAMELMSDPSSPDLESHKMYLDSLINRYPDLWDQLMKAQLEAGKRNRELSLKKNNLKPVKVYKDVVEAQKKYKYRQRLKTERPDLYEKQKARDSYAKSIKRMMLKQKTLAENNVFTSSG